MIYILFSLSSAFLFALTFFFRKQATKYFSLPTALFIEVFFQLITVIIFFLLYSEEFKKGSFDLRSKGVQIGILAGITIAVGVIANYAAVKSGSLSRVVAITSPAQIVFGVLLGFFLLGETITIPMIIGIAMSIIGIILIVL